MATPVFYDPNQARWKRVRRLFDVLGVQRFAADRLLCLHRAAQRISPKLVLPVEKHPYHPLTERERRKKRSA